MGAILRPSEVYSSILPVVPDEVAVKINELLLKRKGTKPLLPIEVNLSEIEDIILSEEAAFGNADFQDALEAVLLECSEAWNVKHKEHKISFSPRFVNDGRYELCSKKQFNHQKNHAAL